MKKNLQLENAPDWPEEKTIFYGWTGKRASISINKELRGRLALFLKCIHPEINQKPVTVKISCDGRIIRETRFSDKNWKKIALSAKEINNSKVLTFEVSRTWNPKIMGVSDDNRNVGIAVYIARG